MDIRIGQIIEGTFVVIALYLIVVHGDQFSQVVKSIGSAYSGSVTALQGR